MFTFQNFRTDKYLKDYHYRANLLSLNVRDQFIYGHNITEYILPLTNAYLQNKEEFGNRILKSMLINSKHALSLDVGNKRTICTLCSQPSCRMLYLQSDQPELS